MSDELRAARTDDQLVYDRTCVHPGCGKWGMFGLDRGRSGSNYWCKEHLPDDYWSPTIRPAELVNGAAQVAPHSRGL